MWSADAIDDFSEELRNQDILEAMMRDEEEQKTLSGQFRREGMDGSISHSTDIATELAHQMEDSQSQFGQTERIDLIMYPQDNILIEQMQQLRREHNIEEHTYLVIEAKNYAKLRKTKDNNKPFKVLFVKQNYVFDQIFDKN